MALPLYEQDVSAFLGEIIIIETPVTMTGTGLDDLTGFTASYQASEQGVAVPDTITVAGVIGAVAAGVVTITTTIGATEAEAATYAHQLSVTDGVNTYVVMKGQLSVEDALADDPNYFTLAELRAMNTSFADTSKYLDSRLESIRDAVEADFEKEGHCAFVRRTTTETLSGDGGKKLLLANPMVAFVSSITVDGTALTSAELAAVKINDFILYRTEGWPADYANITVTYTHGYAAIEPAIKEAALRAAANRLTTPSLPTNATSQVVDGVSFRIDIATADNPFSDRDIINTIHRYGRAGHWVG